MRHVSDGALRAYADGALDEVERARVQAHLARCATCARRDKQARARGARIEALLARLDPEPGRGPVPVEAARRRVRDRALQKEQTMAGKVFGRVSRPAWAALAVVIALGVALCFAPVRALAGEFLGLFRVQRIAFVEVEGALPGEDTFQEAVQGMEAIMRDRARVQTEGEPRVVDEATARREAGFAVRLLAGDLGPARISLRPRTTVQMEIDLPAIRGLLQELGYQDVALPDSLDGAEIRIDLARTVIAAYGECGSESDEPADTQDARCTVLTQMPATEISAPPDLDLEALGRAYLELMGMSKAEAAQYSGRVDWATTLVVALPGSTNLSVRQAAVDGVEGTLVRSAGRGGPTGEYALVWTRDGIVYALVGQGPDEEAFAIAAGLR